MKTGDQEGFAFVKKTYYTHETDNTARSRREKHKRGEESRKNSRIQAATTTTDGGIRNGA